MGDSFNEQTTSVVVLDDINNTYNVQSSLGKTVTPFHKYPYTLSTVTMSSSLPLIGIFDQTQLTAISSTVVGAGTEVYLPPSMLAIEFTKLVLELESNCTANDKDEGKKRKTDHITMIVNNWLPYSNPATSCHTGKVLYIP